MAGFPTAASAFRAMRSRCSFLSMVGKIYKRYREKQLAWRAFYQAGQQGCAAAIALYAELDALRKELDDVERRRRE